MNAAAGAAGIGLARWCLPRGSWRASGSVARASQRYVIQIPAEVPEGTYVLAGDIWPFGEPVGFFIAPQSELALAQVTVGTPSPPRLAALLLDSAGTGGSRGAMAREDRDVCGLAPRNVLLPDKLIVPRDGTARDIAGESYRITGTYDVYVARPLDMDIVPEPGTPLRPGAPFRPQVRILPAFPARIEIEFVHFPRSDPAVTRSISGAANRWGVFVAAEEIATGRTSAGTIAGAVPEDRMCGLPPAPGLHGQRTARRRGPIPAARCG